MKVIWCLIFVFVFNQKLHALQGESLDSLKQVVVDMPDDSLKTETFLRIAYMLYAGDESERYAMQGLILAKKLKNLPLIGKAYHRLAWCHGLDEMDKKSAYLDSASLVFSSLNDTNGLGNVFDTKGTMLMTYGSLEEAMISYQQAYDYYAQSDNKEREAAVLNNWAIAEYSLGNPEEAIRKFNEALAFRIVENPVSRIDIARLYQGLGECHRMLGNWGLAAKNYLKGYEHRKAANNIGVTESLLSLASLFYELAENKVDTTELLGVIQENGFENSQQFIQMAENTPGVEDRVGIQDAIMEAKKKRFLLAGDFESAYQILLQQKKFQEDYLLRESSLEALADMKIKFEKDQLTIKLLEEEVVNQKYQERLTMLWIFLGAMLLLLVIGFLYNQNRAKSAQLELNEAHREQQIIAMKSMLEGQEKERSRIARDLHDGLGNLLSTLKVNFGSLQVNFDDQYSQKIYGSASQMIDEACTEVRKIAHEMMPQALKKLGLKKALEDLVLKMNSSHEFETEFHVHGKEQIFDDNTNVMLYRIVQEALNNIVKYAKASEVLIQLTYSEEWIDLTIEDDGVGFDPKKIDPDKGMGLKSIAFRTEFIGGTLDLTSSPGRGTLIAINIPLKPESNT
ncbi:sensor histidine kinase [Algoriphagus zhangzhouensis]|uniref:Oxygen sensor histidine kinase NreB n=1 Tax=Algoriphagus zhangzhouensis TaxID=1073327 RepID=A0A1M7ZC95_9BACT|nr:sensor histidine kinase [Algoriphagus zhangzhouensis]TDY45509.1 signal transduction histidine kinase [Algoriphagus zhangzhouensis]SHO62480.1 Signal transduction histidine kinase [Algoriphagus zhangzhouensis]